jgi:hypothetical protein
VHTDPTGLPLSADIVQSGFATSLLQVPRPTPTPTAHRYVRRNWGHVETNLGFIVSFVNTLHGQGASENADPTTTDGLFSFALPDSLPGSDLAEVQLWKVSSLGHDPAFANGDTLLYDKMQQQAAPTDLGFNTPVPAAGQVHGHRGYGRGSSRPQRRRQLDRLEAPYAPGTNVIHVAPAACRRTRSRFPSWVGGTG